MSFLDRFFGPTYDKELKDIDPVVDQINALEADFEALSDEQLQEMSDMIQQARQENQS